MDDEGDPIGYKVLPRGTPVVSSDGVRIGTVAKVLDNEREHIFDGIDVDTPEGLRFLDAPEVARVAERAVTTTFPADEKDMHLVDRGSRIAKVLGNTTTARRAKRAGERARERWDRR